MIVVLYLSCMIRAIGVILTPEEVKSILSALPIRVGPIKSAGVEEILLGNIVQFSNSLYSIVSNI